MFKDVAASGLRPVLHHLPAHQSCCEPCQWGMLQSKKVTRNTPFASTDLSQSCKDLALHLSANSHSLSSQFFAAFPQIQNTFE